MSEDKLKEEGKYWYADTEFPGIKVRMDGILEFIVDANLGLSEDKIEILMKGIGYWFLKRSSIMFPPKSPVSDAVELLNEAKRLLKIAYVNNEHDMGFDFDYQNWLDKIDSTTTTTNVQEQDEDEEGVLSIISSNLYNIRSSNQSPMMDTGKCDEISLFILSDLKSKYTITKKQ